MSRIPLWDKPDPNTWTELERAFFDAVTRFGPRIIFSDRLIVAERAVEAAQSAIDSLASSDNPVVQ